jgi:multidrug efflux pump subunit AcrA (membrane-fusion protein)
VAVLACAVAVFVVTSIGRPKQPEYVTAVAEFGDLDQRVDAVGTVTSEKNLELKFRSLGVVSQVYVKEGDSVRAGQTLALLRSGDLAANIASAVGRLREQEANLEILREGARPEDIAVTEAQVANKRASLEAARVTLKNAEEAVLSSTQKMEALKTEASVSLGGTLATSRSTGFQHLGTAESSLGVITEVFSDNNVMDAVVKTDQAHYHLILDQQRASREAVLAVRSRILTAQDFQSVLSVLQLAHSAILASEQSLQQTFTFISNLQTTNAFQVADRDEWKTRISAELTKVQQALSGTDSSAKTLRDASANFDTRIIAEDTSLTSAQGTRDRAKADILTYETSLRIDEAQLNLKKAGTRPADIRAAEARVAQARAEVARAQSLYGDNVLIAPTDGTVTYVGVKAGEVTPTDAAITMLGLSPYRVEMYVSEIDVPKLMATQSGAIELDAFPNVHMNLHVREVDVAPTDVDGVLKYRVILDFVHAHPELKIGMKGDVTVLTDRRRSVFSVPKRAIIGGSGALIIRVLEEGQVRMQEVSVGMEGEGGQTEVTSGLKGGETIILLTR